MNRPIQAGRCVALAVAAASTFLVVACGGAAERRNPAAPSVNSRAATIESSVAASGAPSDTIAVQPVVNSIDFPPRNEPFAFRQALEAKYRDGLGRTAQSSFVDIEGTIVWTQEYLRYRKNSCSHAESVRRVFLQIDGFGVQPVCSFLEAPYPPRQEPFDFRLQLEAKYRDQLRRDAVESFVDVEGDIVWTQEYLRYRTDGACGHIDAEQRVLRQIDGFGVQPDCRSTGGQTIVRVTSTVGPAGINEHQIQIPGTGPPTAMSVTLTWPDPTTDLDLYLTPRDCTGYPPATCTILASSTKIGTIIESLAWVVRGGETYSLWVDNFSPRSQSYELLAVLQGAAGMTTSSSLRLELAEATPHAPPAQKKKLR